MIVYTDSIDNVTTDKLQGFFVGWQNPPSPKIHLELMKNNNKIVLAVDSDNGKVIGFITAITDGFLSAYIPFLEVLPDYQGRGIGQELVRRMLEKLNGLYMVDIVCDSELQPFYVRFGMRTATGMMLRNHKHQSAYRKLRL
jgi:ribosomal protein S18 acetylase RimI-like enzyme